MAKSIPIWKDLRILNLSDCVLADEGEGVSSVIKVISQGHNSNLHTLQLQNDNMESASFALLAQGATKLTKLKSLELQWNEVDDVEGDEGLQTLIATLKRRGGKLYLEDEDEEEEEKEEKEEEEKEQETDVAEAGEKESRTHATAVEKATDDLADLLSKVKIN
jgi:Ran GTPase-activating protein 1